MTLSLGLNNGISNEDYHADREYISSSGLKLMLRDGKQFHRRYVENISDNMSSSNLVLGSYVHSLILEPHLTDSEFAVYEGKIRRGKDWEVFKELHSSRDIVTRAQHIKAMELVDEYNKNKYATDLIADSDSEVSLTVVLDGIKVKVRADSIDVENGQINDVKTSADPVNMSNVRKTCHSWEYDLSAALYRDAFSEHYGKPFDFNFIFLSKVVNAADCQVFKASEEFLANGRRKYKAAIRKLKAARETGVYYEEGIPLLDVAPWSIYEDLEVANES